MCLGFVLLQNRLSSERPFCNTQNSVTLIHYIRPEAPRNSHIVRGSEERGAV